MYQAVFSMADKWFMDSGYRRIAQIKVGGEWRWLL